MDIIGVYINGSFIFKDKNGDFLKEEFLVIFKFGVCNMFKIDDSM